MRLAHFHHSSAVRASVAALYEFHLDPRNARFVLPPGLHLAGIDLPEKHVVGAETSLRLRVLGLGPLAWRIRWAELEPPVTSPATGLAFAKITDESLKAPFPMFFHEHIFEGLTPEQTRLRDRITFRPPFGAIGWLLLPLIYLQFTLLFAYRHARTRQFFAAAARPERDRVEIKIGGAKEIT